MPVRYIIQPEDGVWAILDTSTGIPWKVVAKYPSEEEAKIKAWEMNKGDDPKDYPFYGKGGEAQTPATCGYNVVELYKLLEKVAALTHHGGGLPEGPSLRERILEKLKDYLGDTISRTGLIGHRCGCDISKAENRLKEIRDKGWEFTPSAVAELEDNLAEALLECAKKQVAQVAEIEKSSP